MASVEMQSEKLGLPPGTVIHVGERKMESATLDIIEYDVKDLEKYTLGTDDDFSSYLGSKYITWLNVCGVHDAEVLHKIGDSISLHPLVLEDIANTHQRPKVEEYAGHLFAVLKMVHYEGADAELDVEQVSLVLGNNYVVTFQERQGDVFDSVRKRLQKGKGRIRESGADYLAYALLDVVVDHYFLALENLSDRIESLEEEILGTPGPNAIERVYRLRREATTLRRACWPLREVMQKLLREESDLVQKSTEPFLRDLYDHVVQVIDTVEVQRETLSGYVDLYLSSMSNRMNEVMKVLTIMASIFIPLTFIAGIYGMNFQNIPELQWKWGYYGVWALMGFMAAGMVRFFKKKGWL